MVFNIGVMVGAIVLGFMSDKYGRKKVFISSCVLQVSNNNKHKQKFI